MHPRHTPRASPPPALTHTLTHPFSPSTHPPTPPNQPNLGLAAEHGFFNKQPGAAEWHVQQPHLDTAWQTMSLPILKQYQVRGVISAVRAAGWAAVAAVESGLASACWCCCCWVWVLKEDVLLMGEGLDGVVGGEEMQCIQGGLCSLS